MWKFADPISCLILDTSKQFLLSGAWDKNVRMIDLKENKLVKSFTASKEIINCICYYEIPPGEKTEEKKFVFVAGGDNVIRSFDLETGETKMYTHHKNWVNSLQIFEAETEEGFDRLVSCGEDSVVIFWDIETTRPLDVLSGHEGGVTAITGANGDLYSCAYDHTIISWDLQDTLDKILEKEDLREADIESRQLEFYSKEMGSGKSKKKKGGKKKGKK